MIGLIRLEPIEFVWIECLSMGLSSAGSMQVDHGQSIEARGTLDLSALQKNTPLALKSEKTLTDTLTCQRISVMMSVG